MGVGLGILVVAIAITAGVGGYAIVNEYIPIVGEEIINLEVIPPPGNYVELEESEVYANYPFAEMLFENAPHKDEVLYAGFETDAEVNIVMQHYDSKMIAKGYTFYSNGDMELSGYTVYYTSYLKGATAVGVVANDEVEGHGTLVGFITGNARYLEDLVNWFKSEVS